MTPLVTVAMQRSLRVGVALLLLSVLVTGQCPLCTPSQCTITACTASYPYLCTGGTAYKGCSASPWQTSNVCTGCCDFTSCFLDCSAPCDAAQCQVCTASTSQTMCVAGAASGQCGGTDAWTVADGCTQCCNVLECGATPAPSAGPTPPGPTPTPATPAPPEVACTQPCTASICNLYWCSPNAPFVCTEGPDVGQCSMDPNGWGSGCQDCCNIGLCGQTPAPSTPAPPSPTPAPSEPTPAPSEPTPAPPSPTPAPSEPTPAPSQPTPAPPSPTPAPSEPTPPPGPPGDCPACTTSFCQGQAKCPIGYPYQCTSGTSVGGCSSSPWDTSQCDSCCDVAICFVTTTVVPTPAPPSTPAPPTAPPGPSTTAGPVTDPAILTPVPGWTMSPTDFPPPTPLPPSAPITPTPSGNCPMCSSAQCKIPNYICGPVAPFLCLTGSAATGCQPTPWNEAGCTSCCDFTSCLPPPPTPYPASPWDNVPPSVNCTNNATLAYAPSPAATPYGGIDVSAYGCLASVTQDCCGLTPRFNWVLSTCNSDPKKRLSMACNHTYGNTSRAEIYYIKTYQWHAALGSWVNDPTSSVEGERPGELVDFDLFNMTLTDNGYKQDWDLKYGPTTAAQGTNGVGPPAMLFVISAKQFTWSSFYLLNQITLNRGPGAAHYADNCWGSSSGELDLIEPPFWAGIDLPHDRLYLTVTANAGRCFPVEKTVSKKFQRECSDPYCCQMCACPPGMVCFGNVAHAGYTHMGCMFPNGTVPPGMHRFDVDGSPTACADYFGGVAGGADSTAFFSGAPTGDNDSDVIFAAVVDADGVTVMRWPSVNETSAGQIWPGIGKYKAASSLQPRSDVHIDPRPPCSNFHEPCSIFEPSCDDECVILSASGVFGLDQMSGAYAAEAARDGLNWWNLFDSTNQTPNMRSNQLPMYVDVPVHPVPLPYNCSVYCGEQRCHEATRCPVKAPFMCTAGDGINGCSNSSLFWPLSPHCSGCCDVVFCEVPCNATCTPSECDQMNCNKQLSPYYCSSGALKGACNAKSKYFPDQAGCTGCCDTQSCPE